MTGRNYYKEKLSAERLLKCYEIASPRVKQYLDAEIDYAAGKVEGASSLLELGCGYGRVLKPLSSSVKSIYGIDTSMGSLIYAADYLSDERNVILTQMDASRLAFSDRSFNAVICIQNGISAFKTDRISLIKEAVRVTTKNGIVLFSSYSPNFWNHRLEWFISQSKEGLLGEIDYEKTKNGTVICKDGFTSHTVSREEFSGYCSQLGYIPEIVEIDESSLFCGISI